jgi:CO/xanthine dehydrogenase Mo-binding subunit
VRSPVPHAALDEVVVDRALALPGVRAVLTAAGLRDVGDVPVTLGPQPATFRLLAEDCVRYVGEPVAVVLADGRRAARRAAGRGPGSPYNAAWSITQNSLPSGSRSTTKSGSSG